MKCFKFVCKGCDNPFEFACESCLCYKQCECCIYYDYDYNGFDGCDGYCRAYNCDIIHIEE